VISFRTRSCAHCHPRRGLGRSLPRPIMDRALPLA
jgi:hypothetical protein